MFPQKLKSCMCLRSQQLYVCIPSGAEEPVVPWKQLKARAACLALGVLAAVAALGLGVTDLTLSRLCSVMSLVLK